MKKTARNILLIVVAVLLLAAFAGCKPETPVASGTLQVNTIKIMPYAYMGEEFDLRDVLLMEEGVEYSATACYVDLDTMTEYALEVNDLCFTPVAVRETVVIITAKRGSETAAKVIYIPTTIRAEPLDDLYKSSGALGGSDPGISKTVNIDPMFLQGDTSTTSLHVSFNSTDPHPYGNLFLSFSAEQAQEYFTDKVWENAIVTFWVYNPSELPVEFQLRIVDETAGTNIDWQTVDGPHKQRAEPGQWTQVFFSLRKLGTTHRLTGGKYTNDMLSLKFRYDGYSTTEAYSFDFYIDNIDVVDASMYPEIDTKFVLSNETIEQGWENMAMDTGWQGVYTEYDYEFIQGEGSTCSLKAYFNSEKSLTNSFICLSPEAEFDENPDMTGGILSGYFKFEGLDPKVSVDILNKSWETSNKVDMKLQALGDGWYYGTLDLEDLQVGTGRNDEIIRIRLHFYGVTNESIVYVDTLLYEYKYVEKVLEYADVDLINMSLDTGSYYCNLQYSYVTSPIIGSNTVRSLKLVAPANTDGRFTWNTSTAADKGELSSVPNMSYGTLGAWFYFGKQLPNASFQVTSDNWKGSTSLPFVFTKNNGDGWYYGELHGSDIKFVENANAKSVIRWTLIIPAGYTVYVDNLSWTTSYENALVAAEIDPSVLFDGGDLLAGTDKISYDKRHWENVDNTDDFDQDGNVDPDLTAGLTCGVDTENVFGAYSVRSWYFKAAASNNFGNAVAQLQLAKGYDMTGKNLAFDIKIDTESKVQQTIGLRLQSTGWANINEQNVTVKLNPGDWRTVVVDFSGVLLENADVANLGFISLYFDFAANTGKDRAIYIDNVRLTTDAATGNEEPLPLGPEDQFDGGDMLANTNTVIFDKTHWDNIENSDDDRDGQIDADKTSGLTTGVNTDKSKLYGQYSVRNWYFKAVASNNFGSATAQLQLAQSYDMTGKNLAFDILVDTECKFQQPIGIRLNNSGWKNINEQNVNIKVNPGAWKHVVVSFEDVILPDVDITTLGFISFYFDFAATTGFERTIYIDNVCLTDEAVTAPEEPLVKEDNAQNDWTNMVQDKGDYYCNVESEIRTDKIKGEISTKSLYVKAPADVPGKLTFNTSYAVEKGELDKLPNMNAGTLGAWFYFGNAEPSATVKVTESFGWKGSVEAPFVFGAGENGWYYGTVDCSTITYAETSSAGYAIRVTIGVPAGFEGYIDSMTFVPGDVSDPVEPETTEPVVLDEDPGDLLGACTGIAYNKDHWVAANGLSVGHDMTNVKGSQSTRSWAFKATSAANLPAAVAQFNLGQSYDMTGKNLAFDIKIVTDSKVQQKVEVRLHNGRWANLNDHNQIVKLNPGDWKTVVMNFDEVLNEGADYTDLSFISFYFDFAANTGKDRAIYIDNVRLTTDAPTGSDEPLPLGPEDQFDGGDMLANTNTVIFDKTHWDNIENSDDDRDGEIDADKTSGLTTGVNTDAAKLYGQYSVRNWYFKAVAANNYGNAIAQLQLAQSYDMTGKNLAFDILVDTECKFQQPIGIRLNNSGWKNINEQNVNIKVNPGAWKHVVVSFEDVILPDVDITTLGFISFYFDFAATTGFERTIYIDNVCLTDEAVTAPEEPLVKEDNAQNDWTNMVQDKGDYYCNVESVIKTDKIKGEISTKSLYVKTPVMTSQPSDPSELFDDGDMLAYTNTISYNLSHWDHIEKGNSVYEKPVEEDVPGKLTFNLSYAVEKGELDKLPNMNAGILGAWFYFGENEPSATVKLTESFKWKGSKEVPFVFGEGEDGWYYGTVDCSTITYDEIESAGYAIRLTIVVPVAFEGYIDSMTFEPGDIADPVPPTEPETTVPETTVPVTTVPVATEPEATVPETTEPATSGLTCGVDEETVYGEKSVRSWYFKAAADSNMPNAIAQLQFVEKYDITGKNLAFDIKIDTDSKLQQTIGIRLHNSSWGNLNDFNQVVKLNPGDWRTVVVSFTDLYNADADLTDLKMISFYFDFAANTGKDRAIYIDNVRLTTDTATGDDEPLPLGPEDMFDGGDLLANTDVLEFNRNHWENISNTHDLNGDGVADDHVTAGLTVNVDNTKLNGQYSVRSWRFHAVADVNFNNATAQFALANTLDISNKKLSFDVFYDADTKVQQSIRVRLHSKSTGDMFADQTVKVNPGQWKTVVMDFSGTLLEGKTATDLKHVSFYFDFAANSGKERTVYIDNVQLVDMSVPTVGSDEPLPLSPEDQYDGGDLLANATAADKMGIFAEDMFDYDPNSINIYSSGDVGAYSVKSWKFTAAAGESGNPTALIQLPESVNMTGKVLALDAFIENGNGSVSVYSIHNSGWSNLNVTNDVANYRNETITGQWVTLYYDLASKLAEGKDLTDVKFIKFQFSFKEGLNVEQNVYIDNVRLVDPSDVPPADDVALDWTNMSQDKGAAAYHNMLTNEFSGAYIKGDNSIKSLHLVAPAEAEGRFTLHTETAKNNGDLSELPNLYAGTLGAWFYFGENEPAARLQVTERGWKGSVELNFNFGAGENGWYYGTVEGSDIYFTQTTEPGLPIRITIILPAGFDGYIDSMTMIDAEAIADDWIKMHQDKGQTTVETAIDRDMLKAGNSIQSLYVKAPADTQGVLMFNTELTFGKNFDMSCGELGAWFYFGEQAMTDIYLQLNGNEKASNPVAFEYEAGDEGWAYGVVDLYSIAYAEAEGTSANTLRFSILIPAGYTVYIDGLTYDADAATEGSELATDLLGAATVDATDWTDANGLTVCQDYTDVVGTLSQRSWSFRASAAANMTATAKFTLGESVDMTGKYLNFNAKSVAAQNVMMQLWNAEGTNAITYAVRASIDAADWTSYVVDFSSSVMEGVDLTAVGAISFIFDFASNTGSERAVNIDNVELINAETAAQDWIHMEQITDGNFKTAELSLSNVFMKAEESWISLKVQAPADVAGKFTLKIADGMKHRGTISAWFYFGEQTPSANLITTESGENVSSPAAFTFGEGEDGWYLGTVNLNDMMYAEGVSRTLINKITVEIPAGYVVFVDGLSFTDITETAQDDLINLNKEQYGNCSFALTTEKTKDNNSLHSLSMDATGGVNFVLDSSADYTDGTLSCWLYYDGGHSNGAVRVYFYDGTTALGNGYMTIAETADNGWYLATLDTFALSFDMSSVDSFRIQLRYQDTFVDYLKFEKNETAQ